MSPDEFELWKDRAARLDPKAYVLVTGTGQSFTVPAGEHIFVTNAWFAKVFDDGAGHWYTRDADVDEHVAFGEGETIETSASQAGAFFYYCRPALVTDPDADDYDDRYTTNPKGLAQSREKQLRDLPRRQIGAAVSGSGQTDVAFPGEVTEAMSLQVSSHDVAWLILMESGGGGGMNTLNEISDSSRIRFAERCVFPFKTATFPEIRVQGVSLGEGAANMIYVALPSGF